MLHNCLHANGLLILYIFIHFFRRTLLFASLNKINIIDNIEGFSISVNFNRASQREK